METARTSHVSNIENRINHDTAPASVVKRVHDEILDAIEHNSNVIVLTGEAGKGKSTLLRAIGKNIPANNRLIFLKGTDFLSPQSANKHLKNNTADNKGIHDFTFVQEFIRESANLEDKLTIIVDAADRLPTNVLSNLLKINNQIASKSNGINLIMAGLPAFKKQLDENENKPKQNLIYCSMDELNEEDIYIFALKKEYRIKPYNGDLQFEQDSLEALSTYVLGNQQLLDVLLEWCSYLVNENQIDLVTKDIATNAIARAEQLSKDNNILLANSYPSDKDEQNFLEGDKVNDKSNARDSNIYSRVISDNKDHAPSYIPTITSEVHELPSAPTNNIEDFEDEIMPTQWVPAKKEPLPSNKPFLFLAAIILALAIGLVLLIAHRLQINVFNTGDSVDDQIVQNEEVENEGSATDTIVENKNAAPVATEDLDVVEDFSQAEKKDLNQLQEPEFVSPTEPESEAETLTTEDQQTTLVEDDELKSLQAPKVVSPTEPESKDETPAAEDQLTILAEDNELKPLLEPELISPTEPESKAETPTAEDQLATIQQRETSTTDKSLKSVAETEIDKLLATAKQQFDVKNLTTPPGNNAFETYQSILSKAPNHEAALQGIQNIHDRYISWANHYLRINQTERAKYFYSKALEVAPRDEASMQMLQSLANNETVHNSNQQSSQTNQQQTSIGELLIKAKQQIQNKNLTTPPNNNAYETYQQILKLDADNPFAIAGISTIKKTYIVWAERHIKNKDYRLAALSYNKALAIDPADTQLAQRLREINSLRNSHN